MKKRICFILDHFEKKTSRHFGYIYNLVQEIGKKHKVFVIVERCFGEAPQFENVHKVYMQKIQFPVIRRLELFFITLFYRMLGCKVFYNHYSYYGAILAGLVAKLTGGSSYFWHCIVIEKFIEKVQKTNLSKWIFKTRLKFACTLSNLTIGSDVMGEHYKKVLGLEKIKPVIFPNWTDPTMFNPRNNDREKLRKKFNYELQDKVIFFLHGMEEGKGPQFLPSIVKEVSSKRNDVKFLFVGDGSLRRGVEEEIDKMGFSSKVSFSGMVPHFDIPQYYAVSDIFIMPSLFEAFSRCLLEAMMMGLPFVASDGGCGSTNAYTPKEQHPFVVSTDDMDLFPSMILKLLEDDKLLKELSTGNLSFVKEFTFNKAIQRFEELVIR